MITKPSSVVYLFLLSVLLAACEKEEKKTKNENSGEIELELKASSEAFNNYWYQGQAEVSSYELKQARYGEIREGEAILVFVTEDFLIDKQVKKESSTEAPNVSVLKLNFDRQFTTGIYDYSMMTSVFTPITEHQWQEPIKITTSSQEWCGHSWTQINQNSSGYDLMQHSYFEKEADQQLKLDEVHFEDGIWAQIRLNPEAIPEGKVEIFPSTQYLRFSHLELKPYPAVIKKGKFESEIAATGKMNYLMISYPELERNLKIIFEVEYPHKIYGWEEERPFNLNGKKEILVSSAKKKADLRVPYWRLNSVSDSSYRKELLLKY